MSCKESNPAIFSPHWTVTVKPIHWLPVLLAGAYLLTTRDGMPWKMREIVVASAGLVITAISVVLAERKRRRTRLTVSGSIIQYGNGFTIQAMRGR